MAARYGPQKIARYAAELRQRGDHTRAEEVEGRLRRQGRCIRCGRELRNATSVTNGIGPECATKEAVR